MRCESGKCVLIEDEEQFEIVRILDHRGRKLGEKATSVSSLFVGLAMGLWESEENLQGCQETLGNYWKPLEQQQSTH